MYLLSGKRSRRINRTKSRRYRARMKAKNQARRRRVRQSA